MAGITDTERLDWLIAHTCTWNPLMDLGGETRMGYWDDGYPNYGGGGDDITPRGFENPRDAIDAAIKIEKEGGTI